MRYPVGLLTLLALGGLVSACSGAVEYRATLLPLLPGYTSAQARAINDSGDIAGMMYNGQPGGSTAVRWNHDGTVGVVQSGAIAVTAINNRGQIVGTVPSLRPDGNDIWPRLWNPNGVYVDLSLYLPPPSESPNGYPRSINNQGTAVGRVGLSAVSWSYGSVMRVDIGTADEINNLGEIVGQCEGYVELLSPDGSCIQIGRGTHTVQSSCSVNDNSEVATTLRDTSTGSVLAYVWSQTSGLRPLPLTPDISRSSVTDMNNNGWVLGIAVLSEGTGHTVVWQPDGGIAELPNPTASPTLSAYCINNSGCIVGMSGTSAVLWTPIPEPSSLLAVLCGFGGVGLFHRRRR